MAKKRKLLGMFTPASGQMRKEDGSIINIANLIEKIQKTGNSGEISTEEIIALLEAISETQMAAVIAALTTTETQIGAIITALEEQDARLLDLANKADEALGQYGSVEKIGAGDVDAPAEQVIYAIAFLTDVVVSAQVDADGTTNADLSAYAVLPLGQTLHGRWTQITLTSGNLIAYTKPE